MIFGILGGDYRYKFLHEMLTKEGKIVEIYNNSFIKDVEKEKDINKFLEKVDILILPIPFSKDKKTVFNLNDETLEIDDLIEKILENDIKAVCGGVLGEKFVQTLQKEGIKVLDFMEEDDVAILNAVPTAEGAIQTAMEKSEKTIFGSKSLVLGYGRCGKILANMLKGIGSDVSVTYRKSKDFAYINSYGLKSVNLYDLDKKAKEFDFIFNTIPHTILDEKILKTLSKQVIIIDLAQAPGGVDYNIARELDLKAIYCPGLPGRVAPFTASEILKDSIINFCKNNF